MTTAAGLLLYAATFSWLCPRGLRRLTGDGWSPRLAVAAWLTAIVTALVAWIVASGLFIVGLVDSVGDSAALKLCLCVIGIAHHVGPGPVVTAVLVVLTLAASGVIILRVVRQWRKLGALSREHAESAHIVGLATERRGVVLIDARRPTAYCVAGRPYAIVVTTAAVDTLTQAELAAVIAHEEAHIRGRHHYILMALRTLADTMPRVPLFVEGVQAVARLLEMCADDAAARRHGALPLLTGLLNLAEHPTLLEGRLGAAQTAVVARAVRLAAPRGGLAQWCMRIGLTTAIALAVTAPGLIGLLCSS